METKSAGYRVFTPRPGWWVYAPEFIVPTEPRLTAEQKAEIETLIANDRLIEAYLKAVIPRNDPSVNEQLARTTIEQGHDFAVSWIRAMVLTRGGDVSTWTPTAGEIATVEEALGRLLAEPGRRTQGAPGHILRPLSECQLVYSGFIKDGQRLIVGLSPAPIDLSLGSGRTMTLDDWINEHGGDAFGPHPSRFTSRSRHFSGPDSRFLVVFDVESSQIVQLSKP